MGRISFFSGLLDGDISWIERDAINSAHDAADDAMQVAAQQAEHFGVVMARMQQRITQQQQHIKELRAMVGVLAAMLRDNGVVDGEILDARLEAAMLNAEDEMAAEAAVAAQVRCMRCATQVHKALTVMTEHGLVCDRCHATGG